VMLEELDSPDLKKKVVEFLAWAYWAGLHSFDLAKTAGEVEEGTLRFIEEAKLEEKARLGDAKALKRLEAEKNVLAILSHVKAACEKRNLKELLEFIFSKKKEVEQLRDEIIRKTNCRYLGGEDLFEHFFTFHEYALYGINGSLRKKLGQQKLGFFLTYHRVWDSFMQTLFAENPEVLAEVEGDLGKAKSMVELYKEGLDVLCSLPSKCRCAVIYLWGFDDAMDLSSKSTVLEIEDWLNALKNGWLDHRLWLFRENTIKRVESVYRAVKRGNIPPKVSIDPPSSWTIRDIYLYHPRGRDPDFWVEILKELRKRRNAVLQKS